MDTNDVTIRNIKIKLENLEKIARFLKDEVWHLQMDLIALKEQLKGETK